MAMMIAAEAISRMRPLRVKRVVTASVMSPAARARVAPREAEIMVNAAIVIAAADVIMAANHCLLRMFEIVTARAEMLIRAMNPA